MKINKFYENLQDDLIDKLQKIIIKDNKTINGFEFGYDGQTGTFEWTNNYYYILATPYWDGDTNLPIEVNVDGEQLSFKSKKLPTLISESQIVDVIEYYYNQIYSVTLPLSKRTELRNNIKTILNSVNIIEVGKLIIDSIDDEYIDNISNKKVNELLDLLSKKYAHILHANKYNL